jgi:RimJ/RimL family protein N-acetyltransferase
LDLLGVKIVNFKRSMEAGSLTLRLCRLRDMRLVHSLWRPDIYTKAKGSEKKTHSLFSFYRWMKRTFEVIYLIEIRENGERRIVGFVGLYDLELGRKLSLSLVVFHPGDRSHGYGEKALTLLLNLVERNGAARAVYAEILKNNVPSLRLFLKAGFRLKEVDQNRLLLEIKGKTKLEEDDDDK